MRVENKQFYYFDEEEKGRFTDFLRESRTSITQFANMCGISVPLLSLILNGKRAITKNVIQEFENHGFKVDLGGE